MWAVVGCRQENPDWRGPVVGTDSSDPTITTTTTTTTTTSAAGSSGGEFTCDNPDLTLCDFECVDTQSNDKHCGECGNNCVGNRTCVDGNCEK
jgi:hypothetical protein